MLAEVITRLASSLDTGLFGRVYPLVRIIHEASEGGIKKYPGIHVSKGQYKHILEDSDGGVLYHRINGDINSLQSDIIQTTSCSRDNIIRLEFPIKQVSFLPRNIMQCSDIHADEEIMLWIIDKTYKAELSESEIEADIKLSRVTFDSVRVLSEEYSNIDMIDINYEWSYISLEWNLTIQTNLNCICNDSLY